MTIRTRVLSKWPKIVQGTGGVTISESNGRATIGFDYTTSQLGTELQQAVDTASAQAAASVIAAQAAVASVTVGTTAGTIAAGDDGRFYISQTGSGAAARTLSDLYTDRLFMPEMYAGCKGDAIEFQDTISIAGSMVSFGTGRFTADDVGKIIGLGGAGYYVADGSVIGAGAPAAAGTGYGANTIAGPLTFSGGTGPSDPTTIYMMTNGSGGLSAFNQIANPGRYSAPPPNPITLTGGTGSGGQVNMGWRNLPHVTTIAQVLSATQIVVANAPIVALAGALQTVVYGSDDTQPVKQCFAAAIAAQARGVNVEVHLARGYICASGVAGNLSASGHAFSLTGNGTIFFKLDADNAWGLALVGPGPSGSTYVVTADVAKGGNVLTVGSSSFSKQDILRVLSQTGAAIPRGQLTQIDDVGISSTYSLYYPIKFGIDHIQPSEIQKIICAKNLTIDGVTIDGFLTLGKTSIGLVLEYFVRPEVKARLRRWWTKDASAFNPYAVLDGKFDVHTFECGGGTGADAITTSYLTACSGLLQVTKSWAFGIGVNYSSGNPDLTLIANYTLGRTIKFAYSCANKGRASAHVSVPAEFVGLGFTLGSSDNDFELDASGHYNAIWTDGSGANGNTVRNARLWNNTVDVSISANDIGNCIHFAAATVAPTIQDNGTGTVFEKPGALMPRASVTPNSNGDLVWQLTSNTSLAVKVKGSDGVVRSSALTLA